ncbi:hypothetical protein IT570_14770 [Candidatus Sumerlaeota bacterium]|nr:hypothetical protein [Candidatus Sumerlaeota bacterium]
MILPGFRTTLRWVLPLMALLISSCAHKAQHASEAQVAPPFPGFSKSTHFDEQVLSYRFEPGVSVLINAPAAKKFDAGKPTELILYATPNGNTIDQTFGRKLGPGDDWHFDIQHIGAQTRMLRERMTDRNLIVAYLEADGKSWPAWRKAHEDYRVLIPKLMEDMKARLPVKPAGITLSGHSGGGSFLIGFINSHAVIPAEVDRIAFLDANYSYDTDEGHGDKLLAWLRGAPGRTLVVLAYDDRNIMLNGKKVVSDTGGTFRATQRMRERLEKDVVFSETTIGPIQEQSAMGGQIRFLVHRNPENKILHTVMVGEMNGFIHAMTLSTPLEGRIASYSPPRAYSAYIQEDTDASSPPVTEKAATGLRIPPRTSGALTGSQFAKSVMALNRQEREARVIEQARAGNVPGFMRKFVPVPVEAVCPDGVKRRGEIMVAPDYLAIGGDDDYVRMPLTPITAQAIADMMGATLPTTKMVDGIYDASTCRIGFQPLTEDRESMAAFVKSNDITETYRKKCPAGGLVGGGKKDIVLTNRLKEREGRVAIYGWQQEDGRPIQPLTIVHSDMYVDYSHGVRLVSRMMTVDGKPAAVADVLNDPNLCVLVSNEGTISVRYPDPPPEVRL